MATGTAMLRRRALCLNASSAQTLIGNTANDTFGVNGSPIRGFPRPAATTGSNAAVSDPLPTRGGFLVLEAGTSASATAMRGRHALCGQSSPWRRRSPAQCERHRLWFIIPVVRCRGAKARQPRRGLYSAVAYNAAAPGRHPDPEASATLGVGNSDAAATTSTPHPSQAATLIVNSHHYTSRLQLSPDMW